jgi:histone deacetylase HOS3
MVRHAYQHMAPLFDCCICTAHLRHGIKRAIILDFDLHHGNGTQSIVWSINADTDRREDESKARVSAGLEPLPSGLRVYYASLHDIHSFPCEVCRLTTLTT